ncbi:MAG: translocation/assembly module TamB domain-containing protein, partial [Flavobacteriales bacterium]
KIYIEAQLKTTKGTQFVLPMDAGTSSTWSSFVEIIDHSAQENIDTESVEENQRKTSVRLDLMIDVDQESEARIVFDEAVGDEIIGKCEGVIHLALDDFERLAMFGSLEVIEGEYLFTLSNFINKRFVAEPGGTIKWFGDPYKAEIDLRTLYSTRTSLLPITPEALDNSKQRVDLILEMNGELMRP